MTITREQLELAAKAAGMSDASWSIHEHCIVTARLPGFQCYWRPHKDHGQLHDLAMACKIAIDPRGNKITYLSDGESYVSAKVVRVDCQDFPALAEVVILAAAEQQLAKENGE